MTPEELYKVYAAWTGQLHHYVVKHLDRHVDVEFFPNDYMFRIYSGRGEDAIMSLGGTTIPGLTRPGGERSEAVKVPRPEDSPTQEALDEAFGELCLAAARVLNFGIGKARLPASNAPESEKHASLKDAPKRDHPKNRKSHDKKRSGVVRVRRPRRSRKGRSSPTGSNRERGA